MKNDFWETLDYFFSWGFFYGAVAGAYIGTGVIPLIGTILGGIFGGMIGIALGVISGIVVSRIQGQGFHSDMDLEAYSRRLARLFGVTAGVGAVVLLWGLSLLMVSGPGGRDDE